MTTLSFESVLEAVVGHPFTETCCFLCGRELAEEEVTWEDVVPRWVQRRFGLANERMTLFNRTSIRYAQLKIPCCAPCNNEHLSRVERQVQSAVDDGYAAVTALPPAVLYRWIAKIYIGLLYRDLFLQADRTDRSSPKILSPDALHNVRILWLWLLTSHTDWMSQNAPGSVWVFRCAEWIPDDESFDLLDDYHSDTIAVRMGGVAIVSDLLDSGIHAELMGSIITQYERVALIPLQFRELVCRIMYKSRLLDLATEVSLEPQEDGAMRALFATKSTVPGEDHFRPWESRKYAEILSAYTGLPIEDIFEPPDKVMTWLHDDEGNLKEYLPVDSPGASTS